VQPVGQIAAGREGDIWFVTFGAIGRLSPSSGKLKLFPRRKVSGPLVAGPDGRIWFADGHNRIGRITPSGRIDDIPLPGGRETVTGLAAGSDGSVWFTAERTGVVGRVVLGGG
jgi:virginiamycin B lyase